MAKVWEQTRANNDLWDGGGLHKGGTGVLSINGKRVGQGRIEKTQGECWSLAGETADVGMDAYSPVTDDYDPWDNAFTGAIKVVRIKHKEPPADHDKQKGGAVAHASSPGPEWSAKQ